MLAPPPEIRTRIGLIIPSSNRLTEPQMRQYAPPDVEVHATRLRMTGSSHVPLRELLPSIAEASRALADARCDVIVFHCTASAMEAGLAGIAVVEEAMRAAAPGAQVATTASAALAGLEALDARTLTLISPYAATTHEHEVVFLEEAGKTIAGSHCLRLAGSDEYIAITPEEWLQIGITQYHAQPRVDSIFLSCTNTHTPPVIQALESTIGCPVLTSNQAVLWYALRLCGRNDNIQTLGRLFQLGLGPRSSVAHAQPITVA